MDEEIISILICTEPIQTLNLLTIYAKIATLRFSSHLLHKCTHS